MLRAATAVLTVSIAMPSAAQMSRRVIYVCPGGAALAVEFVTSDPQAPAIVHPPGAPAVSLPAQLSGSGFRYADHAGELRGKGREVTWTDQTGRSTTCVAEQGSSED